MATTTKTIKKTTYLVSNIVSFIILESIVQTYYYLKNDNNDNALYNLISTCSNDILIISLMFYIGLNCITMMKHHMIATKIFNMSMILINLSIVLEVGFYYSTGQKIHAEIFSFMMEQIFHHKNNLATDGNMLLNVTNLLTHLNHFAFVPIIFAILFVLGLKHMICKVCSFLSQLFITLNDNGINKTNTIFIITGDHGQTFGKNNQYYHGALHEDSTWVPLILYGDLIKKKTSKPIKGIRRTLDIVPTIYDLLGINHQNDASPLSTGKSLFDANGHEFAPAFDFFDEASLGMMTSDGYKIISQVDEPIKKIQAVYKFGSKTNILNTFSMKQQDEWSCKLLSWRRKIHSLAKGHTLKQANEHSKFCGQGLDHKGEFRKLAASTTCGYCNNFGYKCTVKITGADDKVNGEMVEYNRKEPESGICMWSKKCDNAQCILRYAGKSGRWEILSTRSSNKVAYYKTTTEKDPKKVDLSKGWEKGEIGTNTNPTAMTLTFTCTDYAIPASCTECDHLTDTSCLSTGNQIYTVGNSFVFSCITLAITFWLFVLM